MLQVDMLSREGADPGPAITKRLIERMGNRISVEDNPGGDSRFWFELRSPIDSDN